MKRIGMLTSGGDCQALNAAMRGVAKAMLNANEKVEIYGFQDGYQGLIYGRFRLLTYADFTGILTKGGTFLGTSRTPFKTIQVPGPDGVDKVAAMKQTAEKNHVPLVDLYSMSRCELKKAGEPDSRKWYMYFDANLYQNYPEGKQDNTHLRYEGAMLYAGLIAKGLLALGGIYAELIVEGAPNYYAKV